MTPQQQRELILWLNQYAAATDQLTDRLYESLLPLYAAASAASATQVATTSSAAAAQSRAAQALAAGLAARYLANIMSIQTGIPIPVPSFPSTPIRNGAALEYVFARPFKHLRRALARGVPPDKAQQLFLGQLATVVSANVRMAERLAWQRMFEVYGDKVGVTGYRRVVHPELSRTGSCGLCIVASDKVYSTAVLMPMHARCKCSIMPIIGALDPGSSLNNLALSDLYGAVGSNKAAALKRTRVEVAEHGEWGPVLVKQGHKFTGPDDLLPVSTSPAAIEASRKFQDLLAKLAQAAKPSTLSA